MKKLLLQSSGLILLLALSGCGGTKVLKESQPIESTQPLATVSDQRVTATLDWVIVRDGPGTWARNANWDEYLLRVSNQSDQPIRVTELIVVDSLNTRIESQPGLKQLVKGSKKTARRYKKSGIKVRAGSGTKGMLIAGATGVGAAWGYASVGSGAFVGAGVGAAAGAVYVLVPALVVGGIVRKSNNFAVNTQIEQRQTIMPLEVLAGDELMLDVFFPLAPSPVTVELAYSDTTGEHVIVIDTSAALNGLHIESSVE